VTQVIPKAGAHPYLVQHYSQQPSYGNSQEAPEDQGKCGIYTQ
jgi:hypothetical protein